MQAVPCSLATTYGISVDFFSFCYLDVSVRRVRHHLPIYSGAVTLAGGFPHSDIPGSKLACQLPETLRRLPRPSSPVIAKASTTCTYSLDPITLKPEPFYTQIPRQGVTLPVIGFSKALRTTFKTTETKRCSNILILQSNNPLNTRTSSQSSCVHFTSSILLKNKLFVLSDASREGSGLITHD